MGYLFWGSEFSLFLCCFFRVSGFVYIRKGRAGDQPGERGKRNCEISFFDGLYHLWLGAQQQQQQWEAHFNVCRDLIRGR